MAGILGIVDLQQIRQSLGLSRFSIPSPAEVDKIAREKFAAPPLPMTTLPDPATLNEYATKVQGAKTMASMFYRKDGYSVGDLVFDLILSEEHAFASNISGHPVEEGAEVSDHIQQLLQVGKLKGLVSNFSIQNRVVDRSTVRQDNAFGTGRAGMAWEVCRRIWQNREPVTIVTCLDTYRDVGISEITTRRDGESGDALEIEISFKQMRIVKLKEWKAETVVGPKDMHLGISKQAAVKKSQGKVVGKPTTLNPAATYVPGSVQSPSSKSDWFKLDLTRAQADSDATSVYP